jgi:hypothetical protein
VVLFGFPANNRSRAFATSANLKLILWTIKSAFAIFDINTGLRFRLRLRNRFCFYVWKKSFAFATHA